MTIAKQYIKHAGIVVPEIKGAKGGKGGSTIAPNSIFSTDFLFLTTAVGEGPVYRINPNGPQDIQIQDSSIDDLLNMDTDGSIDLENFNVAYTTGTVTQAPLPIFGDAVITPQGFASPITLRSGPPAVIPSGAVYSPRSEIRAQQTSAYPWDAIRFIFNIDALSVTDSSGNVSAYSAGITIRIYKSDGVTLITNDVFSIVGKTDKPVRRVREIQIQPADQDAGGYVFYISKSSQDSSSAKRVANISVVGWFEIENKKQAYPRTAIIGYGIKAANEHTGGIPTFTSMVKGLLVEVPSNYNQPVLSRQKIQNVNAYYERAGEIDWRELEVADVSTIVTINNTLYNISYTSSGYSLQKPGADTKLTAQNPQIYIGTWDGTFVYSWTQNPVWIIYDILTNQTYGLGIPEENIDKYKFYQIAQYCDACDPVTGRFIGVKGLADGSYRYKPRGMYNIVRENQLGLPVGTSIKERRFITDLSITDQEKSMDLLNKIASTFRAVIIYAGSKITLAVDMPDEYPVMMFNETTIKQGTFQLSGSKESEIYTGIDVNYIEPTNHFKRETVRINTADSNDGTDVSDIENIASLDLYGVTRRSQAIRMAQYQIAASKYQRRTVSFTTGTDAIQLAPGDIISIASRSSGAAYGYGGKVTLSSDRNLYAYSEDFTTWSATYTTVATNVTTDPNGTTTADKVQETAVTVPFFAIAINPSVFLYSTQYTWSCYLKAAERSFVQVNIGGKIGSFDLTTGATQVNNGPITLSTVDAGNGWWRCIATMSTAESGTSLLYHVIVPGLSLSTAVTVGTAGYGFYIWGSQLEASSVVTDYIKTPATEVALEHFTVPALTSSVFTGNTYPLSLRILNQASDRLETYIVSNTAFSAYNSGNVVNTVDMAKVNVLSKFDKTSKTFVDITSTGFTSNIAPKAGDLWSLGEIQNPLNYYSDKSNKLFKVTNLKREPQSEEVSVTAVEYISNVYVDSDTFINYQPTAYLDITSAFSTPPSPDFTITAVPRTKLDGTVVIDGVLDTVSQKLNYSQNFETEYYVSSSVNNSLISNVTSTSPLTLVTTNAIALASAGSTTPQGVLTGKNGFTTNIGTIKLLCNTVTPAGSVVQLTIEGLSSCFDLNYNNHVLSVPGVSPIVNMPIRSKDSTTTGLKNFVAYKSDYNDFSRAVTYTAGTNILTFEEDYVGATKLSSLLPTTPFYITINQPLNTAYYANNSFYVSGTQYTYLKSGTLNKNGTNTITLDVKPRHGNFVRFYVDGILSTSAIVNKNDQLNIPANIVYTPGTYDSGYRLELDYYTVPTIEVGDMLEVSAGNSFVVSNTSYDVASATYNTQLSSNSVYRVDLVSSPTFKVGGYSFINTSPNPVGTVTSISGSSFILDYNTTKYPGNFRLANNNIYSIELDSDYRRTTLASDGVLPELALGTTSIKARNRNTIGRCSPYVHKSIYVEGLPIQRVSVVTLTESIFIEQTGGASVRVTAAFPAILNQEVTDYEISYKILPNNTTSSVDSQLQQYNTVKVSAKAVESDNYIRYTINNVNRGAVSEANIITVKVTPINKNIRGASIEVSKSIRGKITAPLNVTTVSAGQQGDIILIAWEYKYEDDKKTLKDLDLSEVDIRRLAGVADATLDNFTIAEKVAMVSPPSSNKSVPINNYGTYTYLLRTQNSSGINSETIVRAVLTTVKSQAFTTVAAYNEDDPTVAFTEVPNNNYSENRFPSFADSTNGGIAGPSISRTDNANGTSSGWSAIIGRPTDLKAVGSAVYYTQIRDFGQPVTGYVNITANLIQEIQAGYNDQHVSVLDSVSDTALPRFTYSTDVSIAAKETNSTDVHFSSTGKYMYVIGNVANANVYQYNLTSAWNVATAVYESNIYIGFRDTAPTGLSFRPDGYKMYFVGDTNNKVYEYDLATPWVANTATYKQEVSINTQESNAAGLAFSNTGSIMYVVGTTNNVYQYTLSTPWNVTTATLSASANLASQDTLLAGISFNNVGTRAYTVGRVGDNVYKYTLTEAWNVSTMSYSSNLFVGGRESSPQGLYVNSTESSIYIVGPTQDKVIQYNVSATTTPNVLIDSDYGGIGYYLGYSNPSIPNPRYDTVNKTWATGGTGGNVWAVWNHGQYVGDVANANTYALIAGLINANAVALGASYYANGNPTGSNSLANVTNGGSAYTLVDLQQYSDLGDKTYSGDPGIVSTKTYIRTAVDNVYYANGNVNTLVFSASGDGYLPYTAGKQTFRYLQLKHVVTNDDTGKYDAILDTFRYSINKELSTYTNTFTYTNAGGMTVDYSATKFTRVPTLGVNVQTVSDGTTNLVLAVFTAISNTAATIRLARANGTGYYPADGTATIMLTAQGV